MAKKINKNTIEVNASEIIESSLLIYAKEVIEDRALPDFRDGLKISQRRLLYYMATQGIGSDKNYKTSADVIGGTMGKLHPHGDCLGGNTLVYGLDGSFTPIEELYEQGVKEKGVLAYSEKEERLVPALAHSFRIGQQTKKIYKLKLSDGTSIECTETHPFYLPYAKRWITAKELDPNMALLGGVIEQLGSSPSVSTEGLLVKAIEITELSEPQPMYDFTVDGYENMAVPTHYDKANKKASFIIAHNSALYGTMVVLVNHIVSTIEGHGGFGGINSTAAAMRYTKARLSKFGDKFTKDLHIADYFPSYTGEWEEPIVIPAPIPHALINGTMGIAVGTSTKIPSHNLGELVNTFIAVLNGESDLKKIVGKILFGPESKLGGVMVSPLTDVVDMYLAGKGSIKWRCDYLLKQETDGSFAVIITGIPDDFNVGGLFDKLDVYNEIEIQNESCSEYPARFVVTFDNINFFNEVIEPSLYCTSSYSFNVVCKEGEETEALTLQHFSLLQWIDNWLEWRRTIEIAIVKAEIKRLEDNLFREKTKLWAATHIDAIVKVLKQSVNPIKDLMTKLKLTEAEANIIADMQLKGISKLNKDKQVTIVADLKERIKVETLKLKKPDLLIENTLRGLLKFDEGRIADISYDDTMTIIGYDLLEEYKGKPVYWAVDYAKQTKLVNYGIDLPLRKKTKGQYLAILNAAHGVITVSETGAVAHWMLSDLEEDPGYGTIVGFVSSKHEQLIILTNSGKGASYAIKQPVVEWQCKLLKDGDDLITAAAGISTGDILWVFSESEFYSYGLFINSEWPTLNRSNKNGWRGIPNSKGRKDLQLLVIKHGHQIYFPEFDMEVAFDKLADPSQKTIDMFLKAEHYYQYDVSDNETLLMVSEKSGARDEMSGKDIAYTDKNLVETYLLD